MRPVTPALLAEPSEPIAAVLPRLATNGTGRLLVASSGRLAGFVTLSALLRLIRAREELPQASRPPNGGMP
jgi:CBS domain-containing protein